MSKLIKIELQGLGITTTICK